MSDNREQVNFGQVPKVVVLEDDKVLADSISLYLKKTISADVMVFNDGEEMAKNFERTDGFEKFCFVCDISLGSGRDGLFYIDLLRKRKLNFFAVVMTGFSTIENAIKARKQGVYHYLTKPFSLHDLMSLIVKGYGEVHKTFFNFSDQVDKLIGFSNHEKVTEGTDRNHSSTEVFELPEPEKEDIFCGMVGRSLAMKKVFDRISRVAESDSTVLITGPSGTGKELVASAIHQMSKRSEKECIMVNCAAIPNDLLESELFGHVKGSFTGAISDKIGKFSAAHNSSLFLDEIGEMSKFLQVKILRVIQFKQISPVGSAKTNRVNVRLIAATNRNLEEEVREKRFREDLFYRLNVIPIQLPALNERKSDIPLLIKYFVSKFSSADGSNQVRFTPEAIQILQNYSWPGNVRELENFIERMVVLKGGEIITNESLEYFLGDRFLLRSQFDAGSVELPSEGLHLKKFLDSIESNLIGQALERTEGNKNKASKLLGLNRTTLIEKIKKKQDIFSDFM